MKLFCPDQIQYFIRLIIISFIVPFSSYSQPSGGPYGPIKQTYEIPEDANKIYYVAPNGNKEADGLSMESPTTIEIAISKVKTGDAIILKGGTYRTGNLKLNQGITMQPYKNEQPVFKGTYIANEWKDLGSGLWVTSWKHLFPEKPADWWRLHRNAEKTPLHRFNNDMVFVNGEFLQSAGWPGEVDEKSYYIDYENKEVYLGIDPSNKLVEITAFNVAIHRVNGKCHGKTSDKIGPVIKGITFTQYAYRALDVTGYFPEGLSNESNHGKDVIGTTLENCEISYCSRVAAYLLGDKLTIKNCKVSNTSTEGIYIMSSSDVLLEKNIFTKNNIENITGYFPAAVKIFNQSYRVTCNDNLVIDHPNSNGIWYDVGNVDGIFTNNWLENVGVIQGEGPKDKLWPSRNAFFFEISKGAICAGNVFVNCDHGILVLNSSDVHIYQNTFVNSPLCIGRDGRSAQGDHFGWHPSTGAGVDERYGHIIINNLMYGNEDFQRPLLFTWQRNDVCDRLKESQVKEMNHNVYIHNVQENSKSFLIWSPDINADCQNEYVSFDKFKSTYPALSTSSSFYNTKEITVFKGIQVKNLKVLESFDGIKNASKLPEEIDKLLGIDSNTSPYIGAYPNKY
ncbi:right-handed parallel beta-helix repeat-containing protein [Bacteroidota bacterium]